VVTLAGERIADAVRRRTDALFEAKEGDRLRAPGQYLVTRR
jgi:hypothetical protein